MNRESITFFFAVLLASSPPLSMRVSSSTFWGACLLHSDTSVCLSVVRTPLSFAPPSRAFDWWMSLECPIRDALGLVL